MRPSISTLFLTFLLAATAGAFAQGPDASSRPAPALKLERGICIDRQLRSIPPDPRLKTAPDDIRLVKSLGFEFFKLLCMTANRTPFGPPNGQTPDQEVLKTLLPGKSGPKQAGE
jgi:hypothetical protein